MEKLDYDWETSDCSSKMKRGSLRIVSNNCILPLGLKMEDQTLMSDKNEETEKEI